MTVNRYVKVGWVCVVVLAVATACSSSASPAHPKPVTSPSPTHATVVLPGHISYTTTSTSGFDTQTFYLGTQGTFDAITTPGDFCCQNRISEDHQRLMVMPGGDIPPPVTGGTIDLNGKHFTRMSIPHGTLNLVPQAWSPDGNRIAYVGWDDSDPSRTGAYTAQVGGTGLQRVTTRPGVRFDTPLDYSPDGRWLVLYRAASGDPDPKTHGSLWVVRTDGTHLHRITSAVHSSDSARWSPDGKLILFATARLARDGAVWTVTPEGQHLTKVYDGSASRFPITPTWSPNGHQILFALDPSNDEFIHPPNKLVVMNADGSDLQVVVTSDECIRYPEWWSD
jgi:dipeptidyl aminopeptidase/acylaminoacyl peptidase